MLFIDPTINWLRKHWKMLVAGLGVLAGVISLVLSRQNRINSPRVALRVKKTAKEIAEKEVKAEQFEKQADQKAEELVVLEKEIAVNKKEIAKALEGPIVDGMTDEEIAELYRKSGL